ncbi:MAG: type IV secretion system DNA-binding domain-containing protein [Patescibacteria group bacterium]|nr:type IV secretion system DNA-binding domain-containing protein [Patescibacteria group bacterium]
MLEEEQIKKDPAEVTTNSEVNFFAVTNFRNQTHKFGLKLDDRRRHMYVVGKTGMGKTTLLENMVLNDIYAGHGVGLVDPHGDFAEKIINYIPSRRINDTIYFNAADLDYPIGFNILETVNQEHRHLVASGLMGVFKKIWPDVWSPRMEYILNNTVLALLEFPGTTLLGMSRLLADKEYRNRVVSNIKDPVVKSFWENEFSSYNERYKQEAIAPIQNKIGQFLSASVIRNIVAQVKSRINIREIMDEKKIFIVNLAKGRIGEDNSRLLGGMLITKLQLSAMERVDVPEEKRSDFFLYVDEFQNFANESFANILSEARKYHLDLIMAHQYMEQLDEKVLPAIIGNVGTIVSFRVGSTDAEILAKEFAPSFTEEDLINLAKFQVCLKLMIDGLASRPFNAITLSPVGYTTDSAEKVVQVTRERYSVSRDKIEDKIMRWSGMGADMGDEENDDEIGNKKEEKKIALPQMKVDFKDRRFIAPRPAPSFASNQTRFTQPQINKPIQQDRQPFTRRPVGASIQKPFYKPSQPQSQNRFNSPVQRRDNIGASQTVFNKPPVNAINKATPVLLVDPEEKGISLNVLSDRSGKKPSE